MNMNEYVAICKKRNGKEVRREFRTIVYAEAFLKRTKAYTKITLYHKGKPVQRYHYDVNGKYCEIGLSGYNLTGLVMGGM